MDELLDPIRPDDEMTFTGDEFRLLILAERALALGRGFQYGYQQGWADAKGARDER